MQFSPVLPAEFSIIATMRMPEATLPLQWDLFKIADGHIQYRLVVDGSNRSIRFTVSDNNKYEIIRAEDRFQIFVNLWTLIKNIVRGTTTGSTHPTLPRGMTDLRTSSK